MPHPQTAVPPVPGRHRRGAARPRHRAPETPLWQNRQAAMAAAVLTGVSVTGVAALTAAGPASTARAAALTLQAQAQAQARAQVPVQQPSPSTPPSATPATAPSPAVDPSSLAATDVRSPAPISAVRALRKPVPVPPARVTDPMPAGAITSCFGPRWGRLHAGVDLAAAPGTPVVAAAAGTVVSAGANYGGYGISVVIQHPDGYLTHYAHLSAVSVKGEQRVTTGEQIGAEGSTGRSTGPHLHFEVHEGVWKNTVDPTAWLRKRGIDLGCAR